MNIEFQQEIIGRFKKFFGDKFDNQIKNLKISFSQQNFCVAQIEEIYHYIDEYNNSMTRYNPEGYDLLLEEIDSYKTRHEYVGLPKDLKESLDNKIERLKTKIRIKHGTQIGSAYYKKTNRKTNRNKKTNRKTKTSRNKKTKTKTSRKNK
jgi:low affinity Fe/Cu permease